MSEGSCCSGLPQLAKIDRQCEQDAVFSRLFSSLPAPPHSSILVLKPLDPRPWKAQVCGLEEKDEGPQSQDLGCSES